MRIPFQLRWVVILLFVSGVLAEGQQWPRTSPSSIWTWGQRQNSSPSSLFNPLSWLPSWLKPKQAQPSPPPPSPPPSPEDENEDEEDGQIEGDDEDSISSFPNPRPYSSYPAPAPYPKYPPYSTSANSDGRPTPKPAVFRPNSIATLEQRTQPALPEQEPDEETNNVQGLPRGPVQEPWFGNQPAAPVQSRPAYPYVPQWGSRQPPKPPPTVPPLRSSPSPNRAPPPPPPPPRPYTVTETKTLVQTKTVVQTQTVFLTQTSVETQFLTTTRVSVSTAMATTTVTSVVTETATLKAKPLTYTSYGLPVTSWSIITEKPSTSYLRETSYITKDPVVSFVTGGFTTLIPPAITLTATATSLITSIPPPIISSITLPAVSYTSYLTSTLTSIPSPITSLVTLPAVSYTSYLTSLQQVPAVTSVVEILKTVTVSGPVSSFTQTVYEPKTVTKYYTYPVPSQGRVPGQITITSTYIQAYTYPQATITITRAIPGPTFTASGVASTVTISGACSLSPLTSLPGTPVGLASTPRQTTPGALSPSAGQPIPISTPASIPFISNAAGVETTLQTRTSSRYCRTQCNSWLDQYPASERSSRASALSAQSARSRPTAPIVALAPQPTAQVIDPQPAWEETDAMQPVQVSERDGDSMSRVVHEDGQISPSPIAAAPAQIGDPKAAISQNIQQAPANTPVPSPRSSRVPTLSRARPLAAASDRPSAFTDVPSASVSLPPLPEAANVPLVSGAAPAAAPPVSPKHVPGASGGQAAPDEPEKEPQPDIPERQPASGMGRAEQRQQEEQARRQREQEEQARRQKEQEAQAGRQREEQAKAQQAEKQRQEEAARRQREEQARTQRGQVQQQQGRQQSQQSSSSNNSTSSTSSGGWFSNLFGSRSSSSGNSAPQAPAAPARSPPLGLLGSLGSWLGSYFTPAARKTNPT